MELPGRMETGRQLIRFRDVVKEDIKRFGVTEEDAMDRVRWRQIINCGDPLCKWVLIPVWISLIRRMHCIVEKKQGTFLISILVKT